MKSTQKIISIALLSLLGLYSCSSDENSELKNTPDVTTPIIVEETRQSSKGFVMALRSTGETETDFIINKENIMVGEISAEGQGIELESWRFFYPVGKTLFSTGYANDNQGNSYADNGKGFIEKRGGFVFDNALEVFGHTDDDKTLLAIEINRADALRRLHFINVESGLVKNIKNIGIFVEPNAIDPRQSVLSWPTALEVRGNKLYIPFFKIKNTIDAENNATLETTQIDEASIAIYSYPDVGTQPEKIISDDRTAAIGVNGTTTGLIETASNDLYSFSCGAVMAGFNTASTKPSGILRIKKKETDFDPSYFFNIEEATSGGKIFSLDYAGGNKAIARILTNDNGPLWSAYGRDAVSFNQKLVILDLEGKTVTDVANIPLHAKRYTSPILVENGKAYVSIETASDAFVYQIDIETATGTKGAKIKGKTIKGFYKL